MKLLISYSTKETINVRPGWIRHVDAAVELEPVRVIRYSCGTGAAAGRYRYQADFLAPDDAAFVMDGCIRANIIRKENPKFDPKKLNWVGNVAHI